ncbi:hypothetical protein [Brasilonema sp. UFV-L1]|uniref:hypothetical protein n=1 Tax=Brasilonema sp. UFV-L1 TaxID=2234130 RepID=UPI00145C3D14|nr:hypothetical protein [Brasilonema sp. UFV-L1]NMG10851.1 hypothetical protein [Brasilonema sp. UFV-L1]
MKTPKVSAFQLVFSTVLSLTILSGGTSLWLASQPKLSEYQVRVLENSTATWQTGVGAIFGLLGSKATDLLEAEEEEEEQKSQEQ